MSEVNVRISVSNLVQMDRIQHESHRGPMVQQEQNVENARQEAMRRLQAPVEPDQAEGKVIDPNAKREEEARKRKKRRQQQNGQEKSISAVVDNRGRVVDYEA
ncbi:MAG: hypothetical protein JXA71_11095 [Chitinispirillaceae bacterium]|nr:hypothetical protein [Chitinispirillaceae bacterium]